MTTLFLTIKCFQENVYNKSAKYKGKYVTFSGDCTEKLITRESDMNVVDFPCYSRFFICPKISLLRKLKESFPTICTPFQGSKCNYLYSSEVRPVSKIGNCCVCLQHLSPMKRKCIAFCSNDMCLSRSIQVAVYSLESHER